MGWLRKISFLLALLAFSNGVVWAQTENENALAFLSAITNILLEPKYIELYRLGDHCLTNGGTIDIVAAVPSELQNPVIEWHIAYGEGNLVVGSDGQTAVYTAPPSGTGVARVAANIEGDWYRSTLSLTYGECPKVAVFYRLLGSYVQPGLDPECGITDIGSDSFEISNDEQGDGMNPETPLNTFWAPLQRFSEEERLEENSVSRGIWASDGSCALGAFQALLNNRSSTQVYYDGNHVHINSDLQTRAVCSLFDNGEAGCSKAGTDSQINAVYEFEIDRATDYRMGAELECDPQPIPFVPNVNLNVYRYNSNGDLVPISRKNKIFGIFISKNCHANNGMVKIQETVSFDAPDISDTTDRVVVHFMTNNYVRADPERDGINEDTAKMVGIVGVAEIPD